ncbi:MAG TPA: tRNA lysidine(34) synthetase TilS, partial [Dysgonamonadaceae bacterium]|nr:tRNA lysidine(34) synthetase TilS [Dysgonamonadaceae bacterium]
MIAQVEQYISDCKLLPKKSKVVVGLSGGPDSMVLIHVLMQLGYECVAAHCNFHLRGEDSNNDAKFVGKWCDDQNIPLVAVDFDTYAYAIEKKISIEMAARELRYNWFEKVRLEQSADVVAVAHHKDDSVETVLINLIRGTGIKGLTGIPNKNKHVIRPLLAVSRFEIMEYLSSNHIPYVIDHTNEEDIYTRNTLRLKVLPILETLNPSVNNSIIRTTENLKEVEKIYDKYMKDTIELVLNENVIDIQKLKSTYSYQSLLFEILSPLGFTRSVIKNISNNLDSIPGKIYLSQEYRLLKDRDHLIISKKGSDEFEDREFLIYPDASSKNIPINLIIKVEEYNSEFIIQKKKEVLHVDFDKLSFPLILRKWKEGDWFIPIGMKGKKKISDFFTDNKFTLYQKENTW